MTSPMLAAGRKLTRALYEVEAFGKAGDAWVKAVLDRARMSELIAPNGRYLDLGCGLGAGMALLAAENSGKGACFFGVDPYVRPTRRNRRTLVRSCRPAALASGSEMQTFAFADGKALPLARQWFDGITLLFMLHHLGSYDDQCRVLQESIRALKPGPSAFIVVAEDLVEAPEEWAVTEMVDRRANFESKTTPHFYRSSAQWTECFEQLGLKVQRSELFQSVIPPRRPWLNPGPREACRKHGLYVLTPRWAQP